MRRVIVTVALVVFLLQCRVAFAAAGPGPHDVDAIDGTATAALEEKQYAFCMHPKKPFFDRQQNLCQLASDIPQCTGFRDACADLTKPKDESSFLKVLADLLGPAAQVLLYLLVIGIVVVIAIPVVRALAKLRRNKKLNKDAADKAAPNRATPFQVVTPPPEEIADAEEALRMADDHHARGQLDRALGLYLAASLAALDRRGAIRVAKHRTNGEYVRSCEEVPSRQTLREIVREVDKVEFGGAAPTNDGVVTVAARAKTIVRVAGTVARNVATMALLLICFASCDGGVKGADPASDDLPVEVLRRNGYKVASLTTSLATLPIPEKATDAAAAAVIIDVERVPLEDESKAHLMRWVEAGGVLVLFGNPQGWPTELVGKRGDKASSHDLVVRAHVPVSDQDAPFEEEDDADDDDDSERRIRPQPPLSASQVEVTGARTARSELFSWDASRGSTNISSSFSSSETIGFLDTKAYASLRRVKKGIVLGVANDDLFTNIGVLPHHNAAALVTLVRAATHHPARSRVAAALASEIRVARAEDGVSPPTSPFAALLAAGLGKGAWHALAFAIVLFLAYGIRHARAKSPATSERRAFAEHIEATGAFYGRTKAHAHALSAYGKYMELRLREILPRGAEPIAFLAARGGMTRERVAELYTRALNAKTGDVLKGDELEVIEDLRHLMERASTSSS